MSNQLIEAQRYEIYLGLKRKWSRTRIAKEIGVSVSTVCREIKRNAKADGSYVWKQAQAKCDSRKHGFKGNHRKPQELWWRIDRMIGHMSASRPSTTMSTPTGRESSPGICPMN